METKVYTASHVEEAGKQLQKGELVAFPTETVYGLGALASNDEAVKNVYRVKGRPSDNPLIVHVASKQIEDWVLTVPEEAYPLMEAFWPGPLTLIFQAKEGVFAPTVTGGHSTVALRMPDQPLTLQLIEAAGFPLVGPSANTSGKPSPTSAEHVLHDMKGKIAGILDGGTTDIGVESTVLDLTDSEMPTVLRPGAVTPADLERVLNKNVRTGPTAIGEEAPKAPGMKYIHYSPKQPVYLITGEEKDWETLIKKVSAEGKTFGVLASEERIQRLQEMQRGKGSPLYSLGSKNIPEEASRRLYAGLRYFDEKNVDLILAEGYPKAGIGEAFMNRLEKASTFIYPSQESGEKSINGGGSMLY